MVDGKWRNEDNSDDRDNSVYIYSVYINSSEGVVNSDKTDDCDENGDYTNTDSKAQTTVTKDISGPRQQRLTVKYQNEN